MADEGKDTRVALKGIDTLGSFEQEAESITAIKERLKEETKALLKQTVAKDATDDELAYFLYIAGIRGLNPFARQIYFIKRRVKDKEDKWQPAPTIQTGIDGFRLIADSTKKYAPSPKPTQFEYQNGKLLRATVFGMKLLGDKLIEFSASAKFSEYDAGNVMWRKMPETMLEKVAEAKLLRKGFPEKLSGMYSDDEMQQADTKISGVIESEKTSQVSTTTETVEGSGGEQSPENYDPMLDNCWEHGDKWIINKFGKRCHKLPEGQWCNFNDLLKPIMGKVVQVVLGLDESGFKGWLKEHYDGKTWSKIDEEEKVAILDLLKKQKEGEKPDVPPAIADASKEEVEEQTKADLEAENINE